MNGKFPLRLGKALLKHTVSKAVGDGTLSVIADVGLDEAESRLDAWLKAGENQKALSRAMNQADACFMQQVGDSALQQWMHDLPLRDLPALQKALDALPQSPNEDALEAALRQAIARDWPGLNPAQRDLAVRVYLQCVRRALLPLEEQALLVIGRSVLRTEGKVDRLDERIAQLQAQVRAWIESQKGLRLEEGEKSYLRRLREKTDRVRLAEDAQSTEKDRQAQERRVELHRVYVDLSTTIPPTFSDVLDRLEIPNGQRDALREEINRWIQKVGNKNRNLSVDEINNYAGLLQKIAQSHGEDAKHPLSQWVNDQAALQQALAPLTAVEVLAKHAELVLLGNPGSGKSTFVNYLAYILAGAHLGEEPRWRDMLGAPFEAPLFPIRVVIRRWSSMLRSQPNRETGEGVDKPDVELVYWAIEREFKGGIDRQQLIKRLSHPQTLVMFDGLDEAPVPERASDFNHRQVIIDSIREFRIAHPQCRVLVTSRIRPYNAPRYRLTEFTEATLAPLDDSRIRRFVQQWYDEMLRVGEIVQPKKAQAKRDKLLKAIDERQVLQEMAGTPLLLTMLAMVNTHSDLPERRVELYHQVVQQLLWEWDKQKAEEGEVARLRLLLDVAEPPIDKAEFEKMLWKLTYEAHAKSGRERSAAIHVSDLKQALIDLYGQKGRSMFEAEAWAARVMALMRERSGLLIPDEDDTFVFPHRSFQEYLAARWLLTLKNPGRTFLGLVENDIWHEVILLACGYLTIKDVQMEGYWLSIVQKLARGMKKDVRRWQAPVLAGRAWLEYGVGSLDDEDAEDLLEDLAPALTAIMQNPDLPMPGGLAEDRVRAVARQRLEAGLILADLGVLPDDLDALIPIDAAGLGYAFRMGKYPVTNAQYQRFMDAGGYDEDKPWWSEEAVKDIESWLFNRNWRQGPRYQDEPRLNKSTQPVVGVSWYEARAYCQWLTERWREEGIIGAGEEVRLPTEQEWEAAAGPARYAWGDDFDPAKVNSKESGLGQTTPVHMYPTGATPAGVHDLNGNVWEWVLEPPGRLRGGSWWNDADGVTSSARGWLNPFNWHDPFGFRVVVVPISR